MPAYQVAHNHWFYMLDMFAALVVMLLAASERPAVAYFELPVGVSQFDFFKLQVKVIYSAVLNA